MFTGIIETMGTVTGARNEGTSKVLLIRPDRDDFIVEKGGSVAVDGVCLTLEGIVEGNLQFCAVTETIKRTTLCSAETGRRVNLERAVVAGSRLDGHLVYGHIDGVGKILNDCEMGGSIIRKFLMPSELVPFLAEKGSISIDGISLTIAGRRNREISVSLIPYTLKNTTMSLKKTGDTVNIECDIVARYVNSILKGRNDGSEITDESLLSLMERSGF